MARHQATVYRNSVIAWLIGLGLILLASIPVKVLAQCTGDPCLFNTPTPTSTPSPTPTGTRTPEPDPTSVPMPPTASFPMGNYPMPTSIPLPDVNNSLDQYGPPSQYQFFEAINDQTALSIGFSITPTNAFSQTFGGLMPSPDNIINRSTIITGLSGESISGTVGSAIGLTGDIISYTTWLSGEVASIQGTQSFTLMNAPDWYAPALPRELANVGWTYENLDATGGQRYSLQHWASFFGATVAMPVKLTLNVWELLRFMGPFGLFVVWLVIMTPVVLGFDILVLMRGLANGALRFLVNLINLVDWLIHWIWNIILFILEWTWRLINWVLDWIWKIWEAIPFLN